jgi:branched-chain amino acid transport system substrate-binding protein
MRNYSYYDIRLCLVGIIFAATSPSFAQNKYDVGATDTEIKIGNIMPYSGPISAYSVMGKTEAAYFRKVNDEGGINGRKIDFISYDDAYSPPKAVEQVRKLVESDEVLLLFGALGTSSNSAIRKYMNVKKVPQLFVASGAAKWGDFKNFPWTMGYQPVYEGEGRAYAGYVLKEKPNGKVGILFQNDDFGKDLLKGFRDGLGSKSSMIILEESYETAEPTIDSHIIKLKAAGADVFMNFSIAKFAAQSIRKATEIGWKPLQIIPSVSASLGDVLKPAGLGNAQGVVSAAYYKEPGEARWANDEGMKGFNAFLDQYLPDADRQSSTAVYAYAAAQTLVHVLKQCGDDLTRENVMKQASSIKDFEPDMLLPGIRVNTGPNDFFPIEQLQLKSFNGESWELFGNIVSAKVDP